MYNFCFNFRPHRFAWPKMRPIVNAVAWSVCLSVTRRDREPGKNGQIEMPFGRRLGFAHVLRRGSNPPATERGMGHFWGSRRGTPRLSRAPHSHRYSPGSIGDAASDYAGCWKLCAYAAGNSLRQTVHTHCASVHQAAKLVAALLRVAGGNCRPGGK